ncbi:MAG: AAA family ATPase [Limisphaerales bacterium]
MIERITVENFKSLKDVDLKLGRLNLFVGANASGKSNLFEAFKLVRGIAAGNPLIEFLEGGVRTTSGEDWPGIRGGLAHAIFRPPQAPFPQEAGFRLWLADPSGVFDYTFAFNAKGMTTDERLLHGERKIFSMERGEAWFTHGNGSLSQGYPLRFRGSEMIANILLQREEGKERLIPVRDLVELIGAWGNHMVSMQFLELDPKSLLEYGSAADIHRMLGERGKNFAGVVRHICADAQTKEAYMSWLRELRPGELDDVKAPAGPDGRPVFVVSELGRDFPATVLSGGTLRFAALAASFFQDPPPELLAVEEIENGIHGSRLRLLLELLRNQAALGRTQVLATTHSPQVLAWLKPEEYQHVFLCNRDETTGASRVLPLTEISNFQEVLKSQSIADLITEGWLEAAP